MNVLTLGAVRAAGRRRPGSTSDRPPQAFLARAPLGSASMPAREPPARVRPVGPARGFSARDPASPGVACSTLVPQHARLEAHGGQARAIRVSARGTQAVSPKSVPHSCNRAAVSLAPSESVPRGTRAVSTPRAVGRALAALGRLPTEPSRATSVPASGPPSPQPSDSQRVRGGHPAPSDAASSTAPQRPPGTDPDPGPRLRHWWAPALANTRGPPFLLLGSCATPPAPGSCPGGSQAVGE